MFTMSEIEELFVLMDEYEINGSTYLLYVRWIHGSTDCRKLLVNITDKWCISAGKPIIIYINIYQHI